MLLKLQKDELTVVRNDVVELDKVQDMYLVNEDNVTKLVFTTVDSRDKIHVWKSEYYEAHPSIYPVNEVDTNNYLEAFKKLDKTFN